MAWWERSGAAAVQPNEIRRNEWEAVVLRYVMLCHDDGKNTQRLFGMIIDNSYVTADQTVIGCFDKKYFRQLPWRGRTEAEQTKGNGTERDKAFPKNSITSIYERQGAFGFIPSMYLYVLIIWCYIKYQSHFRLAKNKRRRAEQRRSGNDTKQKKYDCHFCQNT